jgi:hypothetical protein
MKKHLLLLIVPSFIGFSSLAQQDVEPKMKKFKFSDFQFIGYFTTYSPQLVDYQTVSSLAASPTEIQLPSNIDSYSRRLDSQEGSQGSTTVMASFSINPFNKKKGEYNERQIWRFGLGYRDINTYESSYNISLPTLVDTISESRDYFVNAGQSVLAIESSYTFSTDATKPVKAYIGLGAQAGFTIGSNLEVNSNINLITKLPGGGSETVFTPNNFIAKGKNAMTYSIFIPAGAHIRVRKNLGVITEVRYAFASNSSAGGGPSFTRPEIYAGVGLRFTIGAFEDSNTD